MGIRSLRVRMIVFLVVLLGAVQLTEFMLTNTASYRAARTKIKDELGVGARVFERVLRQNAESEKQAADVLVSDFAFREAVATGDVPTVASALENHGARIHAGAVLFVNLKGEVVADTLRPGVATHPFENSQLIAQARSDGNAVAIGLLDERACQLVAVPVRAPVTIGWVVVCYPIDSALATDLRTLTGLNVSFALAHEHHWSLLATTLAPEDARDLPLQLPDFDRTLSTDELASPDGEQQLRVLPLGGHGDDQVVAVLQRPIADALAGFRTLRATLLGLGVLSLALSIAGSIAIALGITRPIELLLDAVRRIRGGDYTVPVIIRRNDEIGALAQGMDHMRSGIAEREQQILKLAYEDPLTKLPNRSRFGEALRQAIDASKGDSPSFAILVLDLDRFRFVNDTLGHGVGDHVLLEVGRRLQAMAGSTGCVARMGGDEYALLVPAVGSLDVIALAQHIIATLERPFMVDGQSLDVGASIGIACYPAHAADAETLLRNADIAMYVAKRSRSGYVVFDSKFDNSQQEHLSMLSELRSAVEHAELRLYYQPKVTLSNSDVTAAESLLRWVHPTRGMVPPGQFIPFAEQTGYIKVLTRWVLEAAVQQCAAWLKEGLRIKVSVNISARDLMSRDLPEFITALLQRFDVPASVLCLEITESGFMEDPNQAKRILERLSSLGLELSVDDYGTGYSSLSYLMRLPVDELKIDRSFVSKMNSESDLLTIVRSTIELGHSLGLKVVAEGVEDPQSYAVLRELGCDSAQGYYMSPPLPAEDFRAWLSNDLPYRRQGLPQVDTAALSETMTALRRTLSK